MKTKKFLIATLIVMAALVMPAAALAVPHVYVNKEIATEGKKVATISWGTVKLKNSLLGEVECRNAVGGFVENPSGGGAAIGATELFAPYNCKDTVCENSKGKIEVLPSKFPWTLEVIEEAGEIFRNKTGNKTEAPGSVWVKINCVGVTEVQFKGENKPRAENGTSPSKPSIANFDQPGSGELESAAGGGATSGKLKVFGYNLQEVVEVKNP